MPRPISVTTPTDPPIYVVQQTYRTLFAPEGAVEIGSEFFDVIIVDATTTGSAVVDPTPTSSADEWLHFQALVAQWIVERGAMSSITESVLCPAYQSIIGMGERAVSFLIAQLQSEGDEPDQWFWALKVITGADPVPAGDQGDYSEMARHWIAWAQAEGYAG